MTVLHFPNAKTIPTGHISGPELSHRAGISYRQLDYWTRTGLLRSLEPSPGSGFNRAYPLTEAAFAQLLKQLLDAGMLPAAAAALAHQLLARGHGDLAGIRIDLPTEP